MKLDGSVDIWTEMEKRGKLDLKLALLFVILENIITDIRYRLFDRLDECDIFFENRNATKL